MRLSKGRARCNRYRGGELIRLVDGGGIVRAYAGCSDTGGVGLCDGVPRGLRSLRQRRDNIHDMTGTERWDGGNHEKDYPSRSYEN
jgi:hypothetical protein